MFLETTQLSAISPLTTWHPLCSSKEKPSLIVLSTHNSIPPTESIIFSKPSKLNKARCSIVIPVRLSIEAARFSTPFPQLLLEKLELILWISSVQLFLISKSLGIDTIEVLLV